MCAPLLCSALSLPFYLHKNLSALQIRNECVPVPGKWQCRSHVRDLISFGICEWMLCDATKLFLFRFVSFPFSVSVCIYDWFSIIHFSSEIKSTWMLLECVVAVWWSAANVKRRRRVGGLRIKETFRCQDLCIFVIVRSCTFSVLFLSLSVCVIRFSNLLIS